MDNKDFFTFREYMKKDDNLLTASMEDYLEMIYRLASGSGYTRTHDLAAALNVQSPSTTKMMKRLSEIGLVNYEKYGIITLSEKGKELGKALLERHQVVEEFLILLGVENNILEETEKMEHTISNNTLKYIADLVLFFKDKPGLISEFRDSQAEQVKQTK